MHEVEYWILYIVYLVFIIDWEKFKLYLGNLNFKPSIYKVSMYVCVFWRSLEKKKSLHFTNPFQVATNVFGLLLLQI